MSGPFATTLFLPWLRRGMSTRISRVDGDAGGAGRAEMQVGVSLNGGALSAQLSAALLGPGDIAAVDPRVFIRTWPSPGVTDAEPNYLPLVEIEQPDLPWRYTPARADDAKDRLRPWLCLAVVREDEVEALEEAAAPRKLAAVTVKSAAALPDPRASWAWAHVQVSGVDRLEGSQAAALLATEPHRLVARLLGPRRLDERTAYLALVVPTFEAGRLAGLGEVVDPALDPLASAWGRDQTRIRLPIYYHWRFVTGTGGDFESLVRRLVARPTPSTVGTRLLNVGDPGAGLPPASATPLVVEGALVAPSVTRPPWSQADRARWSAAIERLLDAPADLQSRTGDRAIAPPIYGSRPAGVVRLSGGTVRWLRELNTEPGLRVAAALGALVVQTQREELMAGAWAQVEGASEIDEQLRYTHLAREAAARLHMRHLAGAPADKLLAVTEPLHGRVVSGVGTVQARIGASPIVNGALGAAWRRLSRPLGPVARRQGRAERSAGIDALARMNQGSLAAAMRPPTPQQMATTSRLAPVANEPAPPSTPPPGGPVPPPDRPPKPGLPIESFVARALSSQVGKFIPIEAPEGSHVPPLPPTSTPPDPEHPASKVFTGAAAAVDSVLKAPRPAPPALKRVDLAAAQVRVQSSLDPKITIARGLLRRLKLAPTVKRTSDTDLDPLLTAPEFPQPMSEALTAISPRWLVPGLEAVPPDTVSLLVGNQRFVEAFLAGLNHAMVQELLWSEYPTDLRATFFRQFWDTPRSVTDGKGGEGAKDIKSIATWQTTASLGQNSPESAQRADRVVLLVRGELLRRYPNTVIYAVRARAGADRRRELGGEELPPTFSSRTDSDIAFFGFNLTVAEARGTPGSDADPGWFFVLQEPPSDTRFGLEPAGPGLTAPTAWKNLSWGHLAADAAALAAISYIDLDAALPDTRKLADPLSNVWHADAGLGAKGATAASVAYATMRQRVRIAIHADQMLADHVAERPPVRAGQGSPGLTDVLESRIGA